MFCTNCGKQVPDGSVFCTGCGTKLCFAQVVENAVPEQPAFTAPAPEQPVFTQSQQPVAPAPEEPVFKAPEEPVFTQPEQPVFTAPQQPAYAQQPAYTAPAAQAPKKAPKLGLIIGIAAAVVVIAALVVMFLTGVFGGPKGKVEKAALKSVKAYSSAFDALGAPDFKDIIKSQKFSEALSFTVKEVEGDTSFKGLGARMDVNCSTDDRHIDASIVPYFENGDIAAIQLLIDNSKLYIGSPEITDGEFYGLDTATLGRDIAELTGDDEIEDIGFNLFDLLDSAEKVSKDSVNEKGIDSANKALVKAIEVKKDGKETISVNGSSVKADKYLVVIPQKALEAYVDNLAKSFDLGKYGDGLADIFESIGLPDDYVDDIRDEFDDIDIDDLTDAIKDNLLDELGDVEFEAYVSGGYISAIIYEKKFDGDKYCLELYLGGGKEYVDDFSLVYSEKYDSWTDEYTFTSSGNHAGKGGEFTDSSKLVNKWDDNKDVLFTMDTEYTKKSGDLEFRLVIDEDDELKASGTLVMDSKNLNLNLDDFKVKSYGDTVFSGELGFKLAPYSKGSISAGNARMLADMDEEDFEEIGTTVTENLEEISEDLGIDLPFLRPAQVWTQEDYDNGVYYGYDYGYEVGYDDGWDEVEYADNYDDDPESEGFYNQSDAFIEGYLEGYDWGYYDGYYDGYPGYSRYTSYGESYPGSGGAFEDGSDSYTQGLDAGYDEAYEVGYQDGWDEVDWGQNYFEEPEEYGYYGMDSEFRDGFMEGFYYGYDDGYYDGYPGYSRYTSYGDSAYWW